MHRRARDGVLLFFIATLAVSLYILQVPDRAASLAPSPAVVPSVVQSDLIPQASVLAGTDEAHLSLPDEAAFQPDGQDQGASVAAVDPIVGDADLQLTSLARVREYIDAILDPADTSFDRLECPSDLGIRYESLRNASADEKPKYFFAIDLYNAEHILPRLLGTLVEVVRYLGASNSVVSIVEGRSDDLSPDILDTIGMELKQIGTPYHLIEDGVNPWGGDGVDRIGALAELRNLALKPLTSNPTAFAADTVVLFVNDIAVCPSDMLELLYQHTLHSAHQTCAMDWIHGGEAFYDVWVSRTINSGNIFFEVPQDADWKYKENLFWDDPPTKEKFDAVQPFEVYACWGGMVTLDPQPFISDQIRFRNSTEGECYMGEPTLLAKDFWRMGQGRVATIPSVNVGYTDVETKDIKTRRGYVNDHIDLSKPANDTQTEMIDWKSKPPPMVKCSPKWEEVSWVPPV